MELRIIIRIVVIAVIFMHFSILSNSAMSQNEETHIYSAKFVCGISEGMENSMVAQGRYSTVVNIHNFSDSSVAVWKKAVQAFSQDVQPLPPTDKDTVIIEPDGAFEIDCKEISDWFKLSSNSFTTGFIVIGSPIKLDVVAVYTTEALLGSPPGTPVIDVEHVPESNPYQFKGTEDQKITVIIIIVFILILINLFLLYRFRTKK